MRCRKCVEDTNPDILRYVLCILEEATYGSPESGRRWTNLSHQDIADELETRHGIRICANTAGRLLEKLGYSKQANKKTDQVGEPHPDRDDIVPVRRHWRQTPLTNQCISSRIRLVGELSLKAVLELDAICRPSFCMVGSGGLFQKRQFERKKFGKKKFSWRHSQVVRQRTANPLSPVRIWVPPPVNSPAKSG